jgi:hypothetical protein
MTLEELRQLGRELMREEGRLLIKVAHGDATEEETEQYKTVHGLVDEIEARLHRAFGDGGGLAPTRM